MNGSEIMFNIIWQFSLIAIETYFITERKKKLSTTKEPGGSNVKPESVAVTMDGEQNVPNATESDNLMNESHTTEKEVAQKSINPLYSGSPRLAPVLRIIFHQCVISYL